jgi:hypothetical protein
MLFLQFEDRLVGCCCCCLLSFLETRFALPPADRGALLMPISSELSGRMSVSLATALPNIPANPFGCDMLTAEYRTRNGKKKLEASSWLSQSWVAKILMHTKFTKQVFRLY